MECVVIVGVSSAPGHQHGVVKVDQHRRVCGGQIMAGEFWQTRSGWVTVRHFKAPMLQWCGDIGLENLPQKNTHSCSR
jgi:hypothetical protein